jgi:hypothetical protein
MPVLSRESDAAQHAPDNAMQDAEEITRFHDRCSDLMRTLLDQLAAAPGRARPFPEIEDAIGWPRRRIASVLGGVAHLRRTEFAGRRPYRFYDARESASGRWELWMDDAQARAVRAAQAETREPGPVPTGGCLCGGVRYEVRGPLRDVLICHCRECRRWHGHVAASTAARRQDLVLVEARGLRWTESPNSDAGARRGFCGECGSSLFWDPPRRETISIAAGTLDDDTNLRVAGHWFVSQAGGYYEVPQDGTARHAGSAENER